jgi:hypothetical protein
MLTSIDSKIEALNMQNTQFAMLNEIKHQNYSSNEVQQIAYHESVPLPASPAQAGLMIAAILSIFVSWHLSRLYYVNQWTKKVLQKSFAHFNEPHVIPEPRPKLHPDQDCVDDSPLPDGSIKASWLPPHAQKLYAEWRG